MARRRIENKWTFWIIMSVIIALDFYFFGFIFERGWWMATGIIIGLLTSVWILFWVFYKIRRGMIRGWIKTKKNF